MGPDVLQLIQRYGQAMHESGRLLAEIEHRARLEQLLQSEAGMSGLQLILPLGLGFGPQGIELASQNPDIPAFDPTLVPSDRLPLSSRLTERGREQLDIMADGRIYTAGLLQAELHDKLGINADVQAIRNTLAEQVERGRVIRVGRGRYKIKLPKVNGASLKENIHA